MSSVTGSRKNPHDPCWFWNAFLPFPVFLTNFLVNINSVLRAVPTIVICAYVLRIWRYSGFPIGDAYKYSDILARLKTIRKKVNICKYHWYPKRKYGVIMHFWEIITLQFEKKRQTLLCIFKLFFQILLINYLWKMRD